MNLPLVRRQGYRFVTNPQDDGPHFSLDEAQLLLMLLRRAARETGAVIVVEDHWPEGGLGDAVLAALAEGEGLPTRVVKLGVREMPSSGTPEELRDAAGISARHIVQAALALNGSGG